MRPRLVIDVGKIERNARTVVGLCAERGVQVCGVTKGVCGDPQIAAAFVRGGVTSIGDSRLDDLAKLESLTARSDGSPLPKVLLRAPTPDEADDVVRLADVSVNTDLGTIAALEEAAARASDRGSAAAAPPAAAESPAPAPPATAAPPAAPPAAPRAHGVLLMADLGDLREGFTDDDELLAAARLVTESPHLRLHGIGANLNCLSFILPDRDKMASLASLAGRISGDLGADGLCVSGGNSSTLRLMLDEGLPPAVTELRLGESLLLGRERATYDYLPGTENDAFVFEAAIVEVKDKPSLPWGTSGPDSFGRYHRFDDRGVRTRAICAFGHQDTEAEVMWPLDEGVEIVDSSSDHTVLDLTDSARAWRPGDVVRFRCGYHAIDRAFTSPYVEKVFAG